MKLHLLVSLAAVCFAFVSPTQAAEVDMSKITCAQAGALPAAKTIGVAMWVNGYIHGKAGNPMVDSDQAHSNGEKVSAYCKRNPTVTLASAIESLAK